MTGSSLRQVAEMSRIVGIDPGQARIGVAISDDEAMLSLTPVPPYVELGFFREIV